MRNNGPLALIFNGLFVVFILAPILVVIAVSFTPEGFLSLPTHGLSLRWYKAIFQADSFISAFTTSVLVACAASVISIALSVPAALAIVRYNFRGKGALTAFFLSPLMVPHVVMGVAFLRFFTMVGVTGTLVGLIFTHVVVVMPYALRLVLASAAGMDRDAERAALSLGASQMTVFRRVTIPMVIPGIVGGWILSFIQSFDELTMTVFVASPSTTTFPVALYNHIEQTIDPLVTSLSSVLIFITLALMLILDRIYGLDRILVGKG